MNNELERIFDVGMQHNNRKRPFGELWLAWEAVNEETTHFSEEPKTPIGVHQTKLLIGTLGGSVPESWVPRVADSEFP